MSSKVTEALVVQTLSKVKSSSRNRRPLAEQAPEPIENGQQAQFLGALDGKVDVEDIDKYPYVRLLNAEKSVTSVERH